MGADTASHISLYYNDVIKNGIFGNGPEVLIRVIAWICYHINPNYQLFLIVNGYLVSFLFGKFIYDNSDKVLISFVVFLGMFFVQSMSLMREWLAIAIGVNAYTLFKRKWFKTSFLLLILAVLSHVTAIVFVFVPIIGLIKNKKRAFFLVLIGCVIFYLMRNVVLGRLVLLFPRYSTYIYGSDMVNNEAFNVKDLIFGVIIIAFCFSAFLQQHLFSNAERNNILEWAILLLMALTLSICGQRYFMLHRVVFYLSIFLIISIPNYVNKLSFKTIIYVALIASMFYMLYRNSYNDNNNISHFYWFWETSL